MDPTSLSNLDPKLKETYEKVMGTQPASPPPTNTPVTQPTDGISQAVPTSPTPDTTPLAQQAADPTQQQATVVMENSAPSDHPQTVTINQPMPNSSPIIAQPHGHDGLKKVFYILGSIVFFLIYIVFWMRLLKLQLPF